MTNNGILNQTSTAHSLVFVEYIKCTFVEVFQNMGLNSDNNLVEFEIKYVKLEKSSNMEHRKKNRAKYADALLIQDQTHKFHSIIFH